jgi:hypothetical protein
MRLALPSTPLRATGNLAFEAERSAAVATKHAPAGLLPQPVAHFTVR